MPVRVLFSYGFTGTGPKRAGWTESHWHLGAGTILAALPEAISFNTARLNVCGVNVELLSIRLGVPGPPAITQIVKAGEVVAGNIAPESAPVPISVGGKPLRTDIPNTSLQYRFFSADGRAKNYYLCGIPDDVIATMPPGPALNDIPVWALRFGTLWGRLSGTVGGTPPGTWGYQARRPSQAHPVLDVQQIEAAPTRIRIVVAGGGVSRPVADGGGFAVEGQRVQLFGMTPALPGAPIPNGIWRIHALESLNGGSRTGVVLRGTDLYDAANVRDPGSVRFVSYELLAYSRYSTPNQTSRKRGGRATAARGRSRPRLTLRGR